MKTTIRHWIAIGVMGITTTALAAPFEVIDIAGRTVRFEDTPQRFVVGNYIANFMMVGGAKSLDKVVGMTKDGWDATRYGEYQVFTASFPSIQSIPSIGGYHDDILNAERILALKPDVLLIARSQFVENNQRLAIFEKAGIRVVVLDYHAMKPENHTQSTAILGKLLDREAVANEQNRTYTEALRVVNERVAKLPAVAKGKRAYMELANKGIADYGNTYNKDILWGAILTHLEANSLSANNPQPYMPLDREYVIGQNPEVIFLGGSIWLGKAESDQMRMGFTVDEKTAQARMRGILTRAGWDRIDAVKTGEVYAVDHGSLRNMADYTFTQYMAKVLYPESFQDIDPQKNLTEFYQRYLPELRYTATFMTKLQK